jgi:glycosyltransferase involved in cell wall biosynthesis
MSKILIHTIVFSPDGVSTAYIYNDIALRLQQGGHEVVVLTTTPHFNALPENMQQQPLQSHWGGLWYESSYFGIRVIHIPQKKFKSTLLRMVGFMYWHFVSFISGLFIRSLDLILSPSPPLTLGVVNIILGKLKAAKVVYNVQEIYPDLLIADGGLKAPLIINVLKKMERFVYRYSDAVTTIDEVFYKTIADRFRDRSRLTIIPNFVDTRLYTADAPCEPDPEVFKPTSKLKVMYAGNIGNAQDWETFIDLASVLKDEPILFFVIGEGVDRDHVEQEIERLQLTNVKLIPYQPREKMPSLIAYADIHFIFMATQVEGHGFPSKVYTLMACSKPMLVCSGQHTPIVNFLKDKECAWIVSEHESRKRVQLLKEILTTMDRAELVERGKHGRKLVEQSYTREIVTEKYLNLVNQLTNE